MASPSQDRWHDGFSVGPTRSPRAAVLVHGFTGTPFEMLLLGEWLAARGYAVEAPRLRGHVGGTRALAATRYPDWLRSVEEAHQAALARATHGAAGVALVGLSLGGLLVLELARRLESAGTPAAALAVLAPALWLTPTAQRFEALFARLPVVRGLALPKIAGSDIADATMRARNSAAQNAGGRAAMPLPALHSLVELGQFLRPRLGEIHAPTLVMHGRQDHTIPFSAGEYVAAHLGSARLVALERSYHVVTLDAERERVFAEIGAHLAAHLVSPTPLN